MMTPPTIRSFCIIFSVFVMFASIPVYATHEAGAEHEDGTPTSPSPDNRGFLREGIFGCQAGQYAMPVGTLQAIGGVYVPVNDAAVTLNTGYLVYKECVLDGVTVAMREAASGAIVRSVLDAANRGRGGSQEYTVRIPQEITERMDETLVEFFKEYDAESVCSPFKQQVKIAIAREYMKQTRDKNSTFRCSMDLSPDEFTAFLGGDTTVGGAKGLWDLFSNTRNDPWGSYINTSLEAMRRMNVERSSLLTQLDYGNGFYPREDLFEIPLENGKTKLERRTLTPGRVVADIMGQTVTSGYRQLENADEIDQIINALFSGITNQIITDIRGFKGLSEAKLGRPPYLDQLSAEASSRLRESATNTGLTVLSSTIAVEQGYRSAKQGIKDALDKAAAQIRSAEEQCWIKVVSAVEARAAQGDCTTSTSSSGGGIFGIPGTSQSTTTCTPILIEVSTSTQTITGGTVALRLGANSSVQSGTPFTLQAPQTSLIEAATLSVTANTSTSTSAAELDIGLPLNSQQVPISGGSVTLTTKVKPPFAVGTLFVDLNDGQKLSVGDVRFSLNASAPFVQAAVSILVSVVQQFADKVIADEITPVLSQATEDLARSDGGFALLTQLANDLQNTSSLTAQRIALERLDTMIAQRLVHSPYDLNTANRQLEDIEVSAQSLVEDTVREWAEDGGWCNVNNSNVVEDWLNRWRI
jgi:hypothetical protein